MKVFISHKWEEPIKNNWEVDEDKWLTNFVRTLIDTYKFECIYDRLVLPKYPAQFLQIMPGCNVVLVILTISSVQELNNVDKESYFFMEVATAISLAIRNGLRVIPILRSNKPANCLSAFTYVDFTNDGHYKRNMEFLVEMILKGKKPQAHEKKLIEASIPFDLLTPEQVDKYISKMGHYIHKLKAKDTTGRWAYYFVYVPPENEASFLSAIEGDGTADLENFGKVIASNYGENPSEEVKAYLKSRYGFNV